MSPHRTIIRLSAVLVAVALTKGCGDGDSPTAPPTPEPARPTTVTVSPATTELTALGATVQLSAEVRDQNASVMAGVTITWTSSADGVATVDASGLVTAAGNGAATITASAGSASGSAVVTVMQSVVSVEVSPATAELNALGETVQLAAEGFDENSHAVAGAEFSWESSDAAVATVDAAGLVTGVGAGMARITASAGSASGSAVVAVMQSVTSVEVSPATAELNALGETVQLAAEAFDENSHAVAGAEFSWESSDAAVATVDAAGLVTGVGDGTATITATAGPASGTAVVTVAQVVSAVVVSPAADTLVAGDTLRLSAEAFDENGHVVPGAAFTWSSTDTRVATVDAAGLVTSIGVGDAEVTATSSEVSGTAQLRVAGFTLSGTVSDGRREGMVVPGAMVRLEDTEGSTTTDDSGQYRLADVYGQVKVIVTAPHSYQEQSAEVTLDADLTLDFALEHTGEPPFAGTVWITPDILGPSDPTSLGNVTFSGRGMRLVFDRRVNEWITVDAYLFDAEFGERTVEFQVNPEFGSREAAREQVDVFAPAVGRLPMAFMSNLKEVEINAGEGLLGGSPHTGSLVIHTGDRATKLGLSDGFLEELFLHEAGHISFDLSHRDTPDWRAAQEADGVFITEYARDYPNREDVAESIVTYFAVRYVLHRLPEAIRRLFLTTIPNRLAYWDAQQLDMSPYTIRESFVPAPEVEVIRALPQIWRRFEGPPIRRPDTETSRDSP